MAENTQPGVERRQSNLLKQRARNQRRRAEAMTSGDTQRIENANQELSRIKTGLSDPRLPKNTANAVPAPPQTPPGADTTRTQTTFSSTPIQKKTQEVMAAGKPSVVEGRKQYDAARSLYNERDFQDQAAKDRSASYAEGRDQFAAAPRDAFEQYYYDQLANIDSQYEDVMSAFDQFGASQDVMLENQLNDIKAAFEQRRKEQIRHNQEVMGATKIAGARTGRSRYATEVQQGIVSDVEQQGLNALKALDAEEQSLITEAQFAAQQSDFNTMLQKFSLAQQKQKDKMGIVDKIKQAQVEQDQKLLEQRKEERAQILFDQQLDQYQRDLFTQNADLYATSILGDFVDENGNMQLPSKDYLQQISETAGVPYQYIASSVQNKYNELAKLEQENLLRELNIANAQRNLLESNLTGDAGEYQKARDAGIIPQDMDLFSYIQQKKQAATSPESAPSSFREWQLAGGESGTGQTYAEYIDATVDPAIGASADLGSTAERAVNGALESISFSSVSAKEDAKDYIKTLLATGDIQGAKEYLKTQAFNSASASQQDVLTGKEQSLAAIDRIDAALKAARDAGVDTGIIAGLSEQGLQKLGRVRSDELAKIKSDIALAIIDYRRAVSGAAFTESEAAAYNDIFPSIGKTEALNDAKIAALREKFSEDVDAFTKKRIGSRNFEELFGQDAQTPEVIDYQEEFFSNYYPNFIQGDPQKEAEFSDVYNQLIDIGLSEDQALSQIMGLGDQSFNNVGGDTYQASPVVEKDGVAVYENPQGLPASSPTSLLEGMKIITTAVAPELKRFADNCVFFARSIVKNIPTGAVSVAGRKEGLKKAVEGGYGGYDMAQVQPGDAIHTTEGDVGHTAIVKERIGDTLILDEANYKSGQVTTGRQLSINDPVLMGWIRPEGAIVQEKPKQFVNKPNEGANQAIMKQIQDIKKRSKLQFIS